MPLLATAAAIVSTSSSASACIAGPTFDPNWNYSAGSFIILGGISVYLCYKRMLNIYFCAVAVLFIAYHFYIYDKNVGTACASGLAMLNAVSTLKLLVIISVGLVWGQISAARKARR